MNEEHRLLALSLAVLLVTATFTPFLTLPVGTATAASTGSCATIDSTTTITSSGCYVVTSNLTGTSDGAYISVEADDVTIKGQGKTLEAGSKLTETATVTETETRSGDTFVDTNRVAVYVDGRSGTVSNVTVRNLTTKAYSVAVYGDDTSGLTVSNVAASGLGSSGVGVRLNGSSGATIRDSTLDGTLQLFDSSNATVTRTDVTATGDGIVVSNSSNFTVADSTVFGQISGLSLDTSPAAVVRNVSIQAGTTGISIRSGTSDTLVTDSTVVGDGSLVEGPGIDVVSTSRPTNNVTIRNNTVAELGPVGISVRNATDTTVAENSIVNVTAGPNAPDSTGNGIEIAAGSTGGMVRGNTILETGGTGVVVAADDALVADTVVFETGDSGVATDSADNVTFRHLTISKTDDTAISLESSGNVTVEKSNILWSGTVTDGTDATDATGTTAPKGFVFVNQTSGNLNALTSNGTLIDYSVSDVKTIGPRAFVDEDERREVPYVDGRGNLKVVDSTGETRILVETGTLGTDPRASKSKLAVGDWDHDGATDVFFANGNGDLFRVDWDERNAPDRITTDKSVQFVVASVDITGDGLREILYVDTNSALRYVNETGTDTKVSVDSTWGANNQIGFGEPALLDGEFVSPRVSGSQTTELQLYDGTVQPLQSGSSVTKTAPAAVDLSGDGVPEFLYVAGDGRSIRAVRVNGESNTVFGPDGTAVDPVASIGLASRIEALAASERVTGEGVDFFVDRNGKTAQQVENLTVAGVGTISFTAQNVSVDAESSLPADPKGARNLTGTGVRVDEAGGDSHAFLLTVAYTDGDVGNGDETIARIARFDPRSDADGDWVFESSTVETTENRVTATVGTTEGVVAAFVNETDSEPTEPAGETLVVDPDGDTQFQSIQSAVDAAAATDTVRVRSGTYAEQLTIQTNTTVVFAEGAVLNGSTLSTSAAIRFGTDTNATVVGATIRDYAVGVDARETAGNWTLRNTAVQSVSKYAVDARGATGGWAVAETTVTGVGRVGVYADRTTGDWTVSNTTVRGANRGGLTAIDSVGAWTLTNVTVRDAAGNGVNADRADGAWTIRDSSITDVGLVGVHADQTAGDWTLSHTTIRETGLAGVAAIEASGAWTVTDTSVRLTDSHGINAEQTDGDWSVTGSTLSTIGDNGLYAPDAAGDWLVADTVVDGTDRDGIRATETNGTWTVRNTTIRRAGVDGLDADGTTSDWQVQNLTIHRTEGQGIDAADSSGAWRVTGTNVTEVGQNGVLAAGGDGSWTITDSRFHTVGRSGVDARENDGNWTVSDTSVSAVVFAGIYARDSTGAWRVQNTSILDVPFFALIARGTSGDWTVANATLRNIGRVGLKADESTGDWTVTETTVTNTSSTGVFAYQATGAWTVRDSTVADSRGDGVAAGETAGDWTVSNVTVRNVSRFGVWASNTTGDWRITESAVLNNSADGVVAFDATGNWLLTESVIAGNGRTGLVARGTDTGNASANYWGASDGPGGSYLGSGDSVAGSVTLGEIYTDRARSKTAAAPKERTTDGPIVVAADGSGDTTSIQTAVDRANSGDTIQVESGTYRERVRVGTDVTLTGSDATLNGSTLPETATGFWLLSGDGIAPEIDSFAVENYQLGVSAAETTGNWTLRNTTVNDSSTGVFAASSTGDWAVTNSTFREAQFSGISLRGSTGAPTIRDTLVVDAGNGVFATDAAGDWLADNLTAVGVDTAIEARESSGDWSVRNSRFEVTDTDDEDAASGTAVYAVDTTGAWTVTDTTLTDAPVAEIDATGASPAGDATGNWWGSPNGATPDDCRGNVACGAPLDDPTHTVVVDSVTVDETLTVGSDESVIVVVENTDVRTRTARVTITVGDSVVFDNDSVTLAGKSSQTITANVPTNNIGAGTATVTAQTRTDGTAVETVETETRLVQPSSLEILTATVPPVATADQRVTVPAVIRNTGGRAATQTVELRVDTDGNGILEADEVVNSTQVSIPPRRVSTVSLGFETGQISGGSYAVGIFTANTSASETLSVEAAAPELTVSTRSLSLDQFDLGASESQTITLENTGGSPLNVSDISFVGRDASAFSVGTSTPVVIQSGESQQVTVTVAPDADAAGPLRATLQVTSSDPTSPLTTASLSANATGPVASTNRDTLPFFSQPVNSTSERTFLLDNRGNDPLSVSDVSITGSDASAFEIVAEPNAVSPSGTREITVSFTPDTGGDKQATLQVETNDPNDGTITVDLSGSGQEPDVSVASASVSFGTVGSESVRTKTVTIHNTGGAPLDLDRIGLNGSDAISAVSGTGSETLVPGETQRVTIQFAPTTGGGASATLSVITDDPDEPTTTVSISGVGQVPDVSLGTTSEQFGTVGVGSSSLTAVTVTNDGNETLVLTNASLGGSDAGAFAVVTGDGIRVPPGESRTVSVAFAPETTGSASATLSLETNDPDEGTRTVSLSGTGADADIGAGTASVTFGATDVSTTETRTVTITNDGAASTTISTVTFTDSSASALSVVSGSGAVTLDPGESQQVAIQFAPTSEGERSGLLQAINDTGVIVTNVSVGGVGAVPNVTLNTTSVSYNDTRVDGQKTKLVRVTNDGNAQLNLTDVSLTGTNTSSFRVLSAPETVQAGATEFLRVAFEPATAGGPAARSKAANATLTTNDPAATTANVTLAGNGTTVEPAVSPGNLTFGKIAVGGTATQTITISNDKNASANLTITRSAIVGPDASAYEIASGSPPFTLTPGETATVTVEINPQNPGRKFGRLRLFTTDPATPQLDVFLSNSQTVIDVETNAGNGTTGPGATVTVRNAPNNTTLPANVSTSETLTGDVGVQNLNVTTKEAGNFSVNFTQADAPPARNAPNFSAPNETNVSPVKYVRVNKTITDDEISNATFTLRVSKVQVEESGTDPSEISLYRFVDGSWVELDGTLVRETTTHYVYSVETPGFSDFAAGAKKPQFNVTNAEIPPGDVRVTAIVVGDAVDILVQITNEKGAADGTFTTKLLLDGTVVNTKDVTIAAGGTRQVRFVREFTSTGTFSVLVNNATAGSVEVNEPESSNSDSESNEDGSESQQLQIDETAISSTTVEPGGEVTFSLDVSNPDSQPQIFSAPLQINGVTVEDRRISVSAGETVTVTYTRTFQRTGTYDVSIGDTNLGRVTVSESAADTATATDEPAVTETATPTETPEETPESTDTPAGTADGTPDETSETRTDTADSTPEDGTDTPAGTAVGTATGTDTSAGPADVSVTNVFVNTRSVDAGDQVTITAIVTNEGESEGPASVPLVVNGVAVTTREVTVSAGTSVRITFERQFQTAGEFQIGVGDQAAGEIVVSAQTGSGPGSASATATGTETSTGFAPGFEPASVIAALLALALLARRRS